MKRHGMMWTVRSTRVSRHVKAPRARVYAALIDANAVAKWKVPDGMTCRVHEFEGREGGAIRISLTYDGASDAGKTTAHTDTYRGRFVELVPNERVVELDEFETEDPALRGEMKITISLVDSDGGTDVLGVHEGLPPGVSIADNQAGWQSSLARLAALVEDGVAGEPPAPAARECHPSGLAGGRRGLVPQAAEEPADRPPRRACSGRLP